MKKRIRYIFFLMVICILGIFGFQAYWLYNAYDLASEQFSQSINDALRDAVNRKGFMDAKQYMDRHPQKQAKKDSLGRRAGWYFIAEKLKDQPYDLHNLDSLYTEELKERGIKITYKLDSSRRERHRSHNRHHPEEGARLSLETRHLRVNPVGELVVQAVFKTPYGYLFQKLFGVLLVSLVLLLLTIVCFTYMLRTILRQRKLSEIKNDFINNMTHELKTPIATVSAAIEALRRFHALDDKEKTESYLDISDKELSYLSSLVEKVMEESVEGEEGLVLHKEEVDVSTIFENLIARQKLKSKKNVHFDYKEDLIQKRIMLDPLHFTNALNNILDNALKYSGKEVHISVQVKSRSDGSLFISITDNGIGIPSDYKKLIFDKFFRVPTGDLHQVKGFGLGLSYVKKVVNQHGGTILVKSEVRKGSTFEIVIP